MEQTVWNGRRWSAANAYLRPALQRRQGHGAALPGPRVAIRDGRATGVEIARGADGDGDRAARGDPRRLLDQHAEAPDAVGDRRRPAISPSTEFRCMADRPGVGANLQDHLELYVQMRSRKPVTLYRHYNWPSRL